MPASNVMWPNPLVREPAFYPGQMGVPGTDSDRGLRQHCTGEVFYVDPNYPGAVDGRDGTDPTAPLVTVADALTHVQPARGDVIAVMANDYWQYNPGGVTPQVSTDYIIPISESVVIPYTATGVRIIGVSNSGLGVMWQPAANGGTCITCRAADVIIEGFVFTEGDFTGCNGIYAEWNGTTLFGENLTVRNCHFDGTVDIALQLEYAWYCNIHHNVFQQCDTYGIYSDVVGSPTAFNQIHDNMFHDCAVAMGLLGGTERSHIYRNHILNSAALAGGAATDEGIDLTAGQANLVFDNWLSCVLPAFAPGDYDDFCTAGAGDAWVGNHLMNGLAVTNPA